jgi:hypothetical protein
MFLSIRARSFAACLAAASLFAPPVAAAAPVDAKALADFEAGFDEGQKKFDAGEHVDAARTWISAANNLKESASNKDNRQAVYEYIADAWTRGLAGSEDVALLREAADSLDSYCEGFTVAYGTETPILPRIVETRDDLRQRLKEAETPPPVVEGPEEPPPGEGSVDRSGDGPRWKGLAIGGGVALGVGVGFVVMGAVGGVRGQKIEEEFLDMDCIDNPMGECSSLEKSGKSMNALAISGGVVGGLLVVTGAVMLAIGLKRKAAARKQALVPAVSPTFVGLSLRGSF